MKRILNIIVLFAIGLLATWGFHFTIASEATNYQFAQVARQYNNVSSNFVPRQDNTSPTNSR